MACLISVLIVAISTGYLFVFAEEENERITAEAPETPTEALDGTSTETVDLREKIIGTWRFDADEDTVVSIYADGNMMIVERGGIRYRTWEIHGENDLYLDGAFHSTIRIEGSRMMLSTVGLDDAVYTRLSYEPEEMITETADSERQELILLEYGHGVTTLFGGDFVTHISFLLYNPNEELAVTFPTVRYIARAEDNSIISTGDQVLSTIYPGQTTAWAFQGFISDEAPATVEFEVVSPDDWNWTNQRSLTIASYMALEVVNVSQRDRNFTGEVINPSDFDTQQVVVSILFRDEAGNLAGGTSTFLNSLDANSTIPFELLPNADLITDDFEIFAAAWGNW